MFFWNSLAFSVIQQILAIWSLISLPFLNPAWISWSSQFLYYWRIIQENFVFGLENFEHYFANVWDECNCVVVWAFFGITFIWDWNENWPFPVLWPLLSFPNLLKYWLQHFNSIIFMIWNSSSGIPSPPLALFVLMIPYSHLTAHSRMSDSRWGTTPLWLSRSLRPL